MKLVILGSGGYYSTDDTHTPCYFIPELGVIFDAGNGIWRAPEYVETEVVHIFLTHAHLDHCEGLRMSNYIVGDKCKKLVLHTRQEIIDKLPILFEQPFCGGAPIPFTIEPISVDKPTILDNGVKVSAFELNHTSPNFGYRLEYKDKAMAYVTDTFFVPEKSYLSNLHNLDLLLHECYSTAGDPQKSISDGHTCPEMIVQIYNEVKPKKLYTIHHRPKGGKEDNIKYIQERIPNAFMATDRAVVEF